MSIGSLWLLHRPGIGLPHITDASFAANRLAGMSIRERPRLFNAPFTASPVVNRVVRSRTAQGVLVSLVATPRWAVAASTTSGRRSDHNCRSTALMSSTIETRNVTEAGHVAAVTLFHGALTVATPIVTYEDVSQDPQQRTAREESTVRNSRLYTFTDGLEADRRLYQAILLPRRCLTRRTGRRK